jgi:hypothetical protein
MLIASPRLASPRLASLGDGMSHPSGPRDGFPRHRVAPWAKAPRNCAPSSHAPEGPWECQLLQVVNRGDMRGVSRSCHGDRRSGAPSTELTFVSELSCRCGKVVATQSTPSPSARSFKEKLHDHPSASVQDVFRCRGCGTDLPCLARPSPKDQVDAVAACSAQPGGRSGDAGRCHPVTAARTGSDQ